MRNEYFNHYWEDFIVGESYSTRSRLITLKDHIDFCKLVGYEVPLFIDENVAKTSNNNGLICPSHLIMSFTTAMTGNLFSDSTYQVPRLSLIFATTAATSISVSKPPI